MRLFGKVSYIIKGSRNFSCRAITYHRNSLFYGTLPKRPKRQDDRQIRYYTQKQSNVFSLNAGTNMLRKRISYSGTPGIIKIDNNNVLPVGVISTSDGSNDGGFKVLVIPLNMMGSDEQIIKNTVNSLNIIQKYAGQIEAFTDSMSFIEMGDTQTEASEKMSDSGTENEKLEYVDTQQLSSQDEHGFWDSYNLSTSNVNAIGNLADESTISNSMHAHAACKKANSEKPLIEITSNAESNLNELDWSNVETAFQAPQMPKLQPDTVEENWTISKQTDDENQEVFTLVPDGLEERLNQLAISSMQMAFEMDMTNIRDAIMRDSNNSQLSLTETSKKDISDPTVLVSTHVEVEASEVPEHTVPLNFNALIRGTVEIDASKISIETLNDMKIPEFNDNITSLAANICSTALQRGFPNESNNAFSADTGYLQKRQSTYRQSPYTFTENDEDAISQDNTIMNTLNKPETSAAMVPNPNEGIDDELSVMQQVQLRDGCKHPPLKKKKKCKKTCPLGDPCKEQKLCPPPKKCDAKPKSVFEMQTVMASTSSSGNDKKQGDCDKDKKKENPCDKFKKKKDPCKKKEDPCKKKEDPCKKKKEDPCKKKEDPCKKKEDPCKKKKEDPCKKKEDPCKKKKEDPCKKKEDPCKKKEDPCKKKEDPCKKKKEDPCKKKEDPCKKKEDPCKKKKEDPCKKKEDPCKKKKEDPCKKKEDPCKKKEDPCKKKKEDPCKKKEDPCKKKKEDPCKKKEDPCKKKKEDPCKKKKEDPCKKKEDPCKKKKEDPCKKKEDPCKKKKEDPCKKKKEDPCKKKEDPCKKKKEDPCKKKEDPCKKKKEDPCKKKKEDPCKKKKNPCDKFKKKDKKDNCKKASSYEMSIPKVAISDKHMHKRLILHPSNLTPAIVAMGISNNNVKKCFSTISIGHIFNETSAAPTNEFIVNYAFLPKYPIHMMCTRRHYAEKKKTGGGGMCDTLAPKFPKSRKPDQKARTSLRTDCYSDDDGCPKKKCTGCKKPTKPPSKCDKENKHFQGALPRAWNLSFAKTFSQVPIVNQERCYTADLAKEILKMDGHKCEQHKNYREIIKITDSYQIQRIYEPIPMLRDYDVLIRTGAIAISGTDIHVYEKGTKGWEGMTLGHDATGYIEGVGRCVHHLHIGDRVVMEPTLACGICQFCKRGVYNMCSQLVYNGFFNTHQTHPADLCYKLPDTIDMTEAALTQTLALGCQACFKANIMPTTNVLIIGCCPTALAAALCARALGANNVVITGTMQTTLKDIKSNFDFDYIHFDSNALFSEVLECIHAKLKNWPNSVINCSISAMTMNLAVMALQPCGVCVLSECETECASFNALDILMKNIRMVPSFRSTNMYPTALQLMKSGRAPMKKCISNTYPWKSLDDAFQCALHEANTGAKKVIVKL